MPKPTALTIAPQQMLDHTADVLALVDEFLARLDAQVQAGEIADATKTTYKAGIARFVDFAVSARVADANVIRAWVTALRKAGNKPNAVNAWLAGVRAFFAWAEGEHRIPYNPTTGVKSAKRKNASTTHSRDTLTDAEVLRVLAQPDDSDAGRRDLAYLYLRAYTGCRDVELHRADLADLQTKSGRLVLFVRGKGHAEADAFVVITPEAETVLRDWLAVRGDKPGPLFTSYSNQSQGERLSLRAIRWMVKRYYLAAGITEGNKTSHSLRHAAITNAIRHGAPVQKAQSMARHASVETTMIYYHEADRISNPTEELIDYEDRK